MRVLVLDADAELQRVLGTVLQGSAAVSAHGRPADALAGLEAGVPDVVMVDLDLPGQAAITFLAALREEPGVARARVLLKSRFYGERDAFVLRAKALCASAHFLKGPVSLLDLSDFLYKLAAMGPAEIRGDTAAVWSGSSKDLGRRGPSGAGASGEATVASGAGEETEPQRRVRSRALGGRRRTKGAARPASGATSPRARAPAGSGRPAEPGDRIARLLAKDVGTLESADAWTVLGIPRSAGPELVARAEARLMKRYGDLVQDRTLSAEGREHAGQLLTWVRAAAERLRSREPAEAAPTEPVAAAPSAETDPVGHALAAGQEALAQGRPTRAVGLLRRARDEALGNADVMIWLGWALFQDPAREEQARIQEALEMLQLGDSFAPDHREGQVFLAEVEAAAGDRQAALERLSLVLGRHPDLAHARRLRTRLQAPEPAPPAPAAAPPDPVPVRSAAPRERPPPKVAPAASNSRPAPAAPKPAPPRQQPRPSPPEAMPEPARRVPPRVSEPTSAPTPPPRAPAPPPEPAWGLEIEDEESEPSDIGFSDEPSSKPEPGAPRALRLQPLDEDEDEDSGSTFTWS